MWARPRARDCVCAGKHGCTLCVCSCRWDVNEMQCYPTSSGHCSCLQPCSSARRRCDLSLDQHARLQARRQRGHRGTVPPPNGFCAPRHSFSKLWKMASDRTFVGWGRRGEKLNKMRQFTNGKKDYKVPLKKSWCPHVLTTWRRTCTSVASARAATTDCVILRRLQRSLDSNSLAIHLSTPL